MYKGTNYQVVIFRVAFILDPFFNLSRVDNSAEDLLGKPKKSLLWQRMKWTDDMVRLLISTVASVEDDGMHSLSTRLPPSISQSN